MSELEPIFFETPDQRRLFGVLFLPVAQGNGRAVLLCPPFAEEMNKSRRMLANLGRALAAGGYAVLLPDLYGTGDSPGDFNDARWTLWKEDISAALALLRARGFERWSALGLRLGGALLLDWLKDTHDRPESLCLWQPMLQGRQAMTQFLRLRMAASLMGRESKETVEQLREQLATGQSLEVAGYELHPELYQAVESLDLSAPPGVTETELHWFELVAAEGREATPLTRRVLQSWEEAGLTPCLHTLVGDSFWATQEITEVPVLVEATAKVFGGAS